jgi:hypothetical protein
MTKGHHIRKLLRKHIPDGYKISSDNMRNFREHALKHYLEEKPIDLNSAEKLLKFQPLVTSERPVLSSLPKETKWLVIHSLYDLQTLSSAMTYTFQEETQMGIEVSCIGLAGVTIDLGNGMYFGNRMVHYSMVRDWLASTAKQSCGRTYSRVILSHDFNMLLANNSSYG